MTPPPTTSRSDLLDALQTAAERLPYPIAAGAEKAVQRLPQDAYGEWGYLAREVFHDCIHYLAHLLLAEIVGGGHRPAHLFHRILDVCGNASEGQLVGFLRESTAFLCDHRDQLALPELLNIHPSQTEAPAGDSLLAVLQRLVVLRNAIAHTDLPDNVLEEGAAEMRQLIARLLKGIAWLERYPLTLDDGTPLIGAQPAGLREKSGLLGVATASGVSLRPLILRLHEGRLVLLQRFDLDPPRLVFRSSEGVYPFGRKDLKEGDMAAVFAEVKDLLDRVRATEAPLERYTWEGFHGRADLHTGRALAEYTSPENGKYRPEQYIPRQAWEGPEGHWQRFLASDATLFAVSASQGGGKSALAAHLASQAQADGHAVFFTDAFRLTHVAEPRLSENPLPDHWARILHFTRPLDQRAVARLLKTAPAGKKILFVIDSVNEVNAFAPRWNRFRVLQCLLEWAAALAQPGFKVLLTFRATEFTDYGYLAPPDLPANLESIAWRAAPDAPWIHELEPLAPDEGRALVERLWETNDPLAPRFSWETLRAHLGDRLPAFVGNPLIFRVFLHAHAGRDTILTTDRDELFLRHVESLTGAARRKALPWWRRALYFLYDGNLTPAERFLADLVQCMARSGNPYVLAHDLDTTKKGPARNVARELHAPRSPLLDELKSGGLLREETIEIPRPNAPPAASRRLFPVAEMMADVTRLILQKLKVIQALRINTLTLFIFLAFVAAFVDFTHNQFDAHINDIRNYAAANFSTIGLFGRDDAHALLEAEFAHSNHLVYLHALTLPIIAISTIFFVLSISKTILLERERAKMDPLEEGVIHHLKDSVSITRAIGLSSYSWIISSLVFSAILVWLYILTPLHNIGFNLYLLLIASPYIGHLAFTTYVELYPKLNAHLASVTGNQIPALLSRTVLLKYRKTRFATRRRGTKRAAILLFFLTFIVIAGAYHYSTNSIQSQFLSTDAHDLVNWHIQSAWIEGRMIANARIDSLLRPLLFVVFLIAGLNFGKRMIVGLIQHRINAAWANHIKNRTIPKNAIRRLRSVHSRFTALILSAAFILFFFSVISWLIAFQSGAKTQDHYVVIDSNSYDLRQKMSSRMSPRSLEANYSSLSSIDGFNFLQNLRADYPQWHSLIARDSNVFFGQADARLPIRFLKVKGNTVDLSALHEICPLLSPLPLKSCAFRAGFFKLFGA